MADTQKKDKKTTIMPFAVWANPKSSLGDGKLIGYRFGKESGMQNDFTKDDIVAAINYGLSNNWSVTIDDGELFLSDEEAQKKVSLEFDRMISEWIVAFRSRKREFISQKRLRVQEKRRKLLGVLNENNFLEGSMGEAEREMMLSAVSILDDEIKHLDHEISIIDGEAPARENEEDEKLHESLSEAGSYASAQAKKHTSVKSEESDDGIIAGYDNATLGAGEDDATVKISIAVLERIEERLDRIIERLDDLINTLKNLIVVTEQDMDETAAVDSALDVSGAKDDVVEVDSTDPTNKETIIANTPETIEREIDEEKLKEAILKQKHKNALRRNEEREKVVSDDELDLSALYPSEDSQDVPDKKVESDSAAVQTPKRRRR